MDVFLHVTQSFFDVPFGYSAVEAFVPGLGLIFRTAAAVVVF